MGFVDPVRLCAACLVPTKAEKEFFDEQLKSLFDGELREIHFFFFILLHSYFGGHSTNTLKIKCA